MKVGLIAREPLSALGVAAMLDLERIPYSRRQNLQETPPEELPLFAGGEIDPLEAARLEKRPAVVLCGGEAFARRWLGAPQAIVQPSAVRLPMDQPIWPKEITSLAATHRVDAMRIPLAPVCSTEARRPLEVLGRHLVGDTDASRISIARLGSCVWSAIDLGAAFVNLTHEAYEPATPPVHAPGRFRRAVESAYYQLPEIVRRQVQRAAYSMLERRLRQLGPSRTAYPVEAGGALLLELLRELLLRTGCSVPRIARWPAPFAAAATITHDIEPSRYSYGEGLDELLDHVDESGHEATFGLVAESAATRLRSDQIERLAKHELLCHGRTHRGDPVDGRDLVGAGLDAARSVLQTRVGREVAGYRSPRLDRSGDLAWALDRSGFSFDSSYPDVDRENAVHFGAGVGLNLPFRPLVEDEAGGLRPSRCLEIPLTAPDCIQPLLAGGSVIALRNTVAVKAAFVRATGGCHVALVHAGVFGRRDSQRRMAHLDFVRTSLARDDVWLTSLARIHRWWQAREQVEIVAVDGGLEIRNGGTTAIEGLRVVLEQGPERTEIVLPSIEAGGATKIARESDVVGTAA